MPAATKKLKRFRVHFRWAGPLHRDMCKWETANVQAVSEEWIWSQWIMLKRAELGDTSAFAIERVEEVPT